jgi:hypothetical protein
MWNMDPSGKLRDRMDWKGYRSGHMMCGQLILHTQPYKIRRSTYSVLAFANPLVGELCGTILPLRYLRAADLAASNDDLREFIHKTTPAAGTAAKY